MSSDDIGLNYAQAFIDSLKSPDEIQSGGRDLEAFGQLLDRLPSLTRVLDHPGFPIEKRRALLDDALGRLAVSAKTRRLLHLVVENGRLAHYKRILANFIRLRDERLNIESAEVVTAVPVTAAEKAEWEKALSRLTGRSIRVTYRTDQTLLGGALTRIGSVVYDGTLRKQLTRIRGVLLGGE